MSDASESIGYKGPTVTKPTDLPPPLPNYSINQSKHDSVLNLQARTMWMSDYGMAAEEANRLRMENAALRESLKRARRFASDNHYTMREFAECIGITPAQLSQWTDSTPNKEPDFKD